MAWVHNLVAHQQKVSPPSAHAWHMLWALLTYIVVCRLVMRRTSGVWREIILAGLNLVGVFGFLFYGRSIYANQMFVFYLGLIFFQYTMFWWFSEEQGKLPWLAFFTPIAILVFVRYAPGFGLAEIAGLAWTAGGLGLAGISYLAFRTSRLVLEVRNGVVKKPGFLEYINFCFFLPTMPIGPINTYQNYRLGFETAPWDVPVGRAMLRMLVGMVKYQFLGGFCGQLAYKGLLLDDHPHHLMDLPVAMLFYYLFLYCNFSGFCDMAIGAAALIGIPVPENFESPFTTRNMREFWNRWHITLSQYMRDMVFAPLSKFFVRLAGPANANHAVAIAIAVVFFLIGIWHGTGWNYALFGAAQSLGVVTVHYYTLLLKKRLGREGFKSYNENRGIHAVAVIITFCYYAATLFFFANTVPEMKKIFSALR